MRKDRISVALTKDLIEKLNEASEEARRSRSDYVQIILEDHFERLEKQTEEERAVARKFSSPIHLSLSRNSSLFSRSLTAARMAALLLGYMPILTRSASPSK